MCTKDVKREREENRRVWRIEKIYVFCFVSRLNKRARFVFVFVGAIAFARFTCTRRENGSIFFVYTWSSRVFLHFAFFFCLVQRDKKPQQEKCVCMCVRELQVDNKQKKTRCNAQRR